MSGLGAGRAWATSLRVPAASAGAADGRRAVDCSVFRRRIERKGRERGGGRREDPATDRRQIELPNRIRGPGSADLWQKPLAWADPTRRIRIPSVPRSLGFVLLKLFSFLFFSGFFFPFCQLKAGEWWGTANWRSEKASGAGVAGNGAVRSRSDGDGERSPLPGFGRASRRARQRAKQTLQRRFVISRVLFFPPHFFSDEKRNPLFFFPFPYIFFSWRKLQLGIACTSKG